MHTVEYLVSKFHDSICLVDISQTCGNTKLKGASWLTVGVMGSTRNSQSDWNAEPSSTSAHRVTIVQMCNTNQ